MSKLAAIFACPLALSLAACDRQADQTEDPAASTAPLAAPAIPSRMGFLGPVSYRYDPAVLTAANVQVVVPPGKEPSANAFKLVSAHGTDVTCPGNRTTCPLEQQPGLTLALLERPYARYLDRLQASPLGESIRPGSTGGEAGIALDLGEVEGLATEYRLVPVEDRALLLKLQLDDEDSAEREAIEQVLETIDLGD